MRIDPSSLQARLDAMVRENAIARGDGPSFGYNSQAWADAIKSVALDLLTKLDAAEAEIYELKTVPLVQRLEAQVKALTAQLTRISNLEDTPSDPKYPNSLWQARAIARAALKGGQP